MNKKNLILAMVIIFVVAAVFLLEDKMEKSEMFESMGKAPEFSGIHAWINSEPLTMEDLKGKVVLIDFWTYSCINCIRTLPFIKEWDEKYRDKGLVIIGVHSPEFFFEKKIENVQESVNKFEIKYPIAMDNDFATWRAYDNHYWPHKFLVDKDGNIRYDHIGEGGYEETEKVIQELLSELGEEVEMETVKDPQKQLFPLTPELYAGYDFARQRFGNEENYQPDKIVDYKIPNSFSDDIIYLSGRWFNDKDNLRCEGENCFIYLNFMAKSVNIVSSSEKDVRLEVTLNDKMLDKNNKGYDIVFGNGKSIVNIKEARLYNLVGDQNKYGRYLLKIKADKGFAFNAFTFG